MPQQLQGSYCQDSKNVVRAFSNGPHKPVRWAMERDYSDTH